jgi:Sulfotransferase family
MPRTRRASCALPNLVVIGSAKSGTTSLHHYLNGHPEISMASPSRGAGLRDNDADGKEMRFFWREDWRESMPWYCSHFAEMTTPVRGEATPAYSAYPRHPAVPERIHAVVPAARLIYIVRDPIERIVSHYIQELVDGDRRSFRQRMLELDRPDNSIVCPSRYATQVERYLEFFASSQLLVVDQHRLKHERRATLREIFGFLGVDPGHWSPAFDDERNTRAEKQALTPLGRRLFYGLLDPLGRRLAPERWSTLRPSVRRSFSRQILERPVLDDELRTKLSAMLQPQVDRLRELTGQRFPSWSL